MKKGTLVWVKQASLMLNRLGRVDEGNLWVVEGMDGEEPEDLIQCRSLKTGRRWHWFADELEPKENEDT